MWWLTVAHFFGLRNGDADSTGYLFWSGAGSDLAYLSIAWTLLRKHNCHAAGCWRIGRHPVEGTTFVVCRRHHPEGKPTPAAIRERWHLYAGDKPGRG